ncbi:coiled-coil domain-containing protein 180 [Bufo gargarizans]|uniref:coiled-coil domain-containing protein 180 n=1 Tax=Bufo gargarizans TaxID=30331 RepID=UPI001CF514E6|nr:coiled-coil domain-containing protein 180 [Bufo gargarizans]
MALVGAVHVVPSGKVYRQIFDAEVQLVRSLGESRARWAPLVGGFESGKIPFVRHEDTRSAGLLSPRQRRWVDSMPYDGFTENPAVYRNKTAAALKKTQESEELAAAREVRGLCDVIVPEKTDSDILQRITSHRQERHDAAMCALQKELADISKEMETLVMEAGKSLQGKICESDKKTELIFQKYEDKNAGFTLTALNELWAQVVEESGHRRRHIRDSEMTLLEVEERRTDRIAEVLRKFAVQLTDICFLMPSDVHRFIHKEAMMINQAILANHRAVSKLSLNLMEAELKREGLQRLRWQDLIKAWKTHQKERIVQEFREFVEREIDEVPGRMKTEADLLMDLCEPLSEKRLQLLCSVSDFGPPTCTKSAVTEWHNSLLALNKQIDSLGSQFLDKLRDLQSDVIQRCVAKSDMSKAQLIKMNICSKEEAEILLAKEQAPFIEQFEVECEKKHQIFNESLGAVSKKMAEHINKLYKLAKKPVHLWDVLQIGLTRQEETLQTNMDICRQKHDAENQRKEADLDIILDTLRQESTEDQLRLLMGKAQAALLDIRSGYQKSHQDQVGIMESYPALVLSESLAYSTSLSKFFRVKEIYGQNMPPNTGAPEGILVISPVPISSDLVATPNEGVPVESSHPTDTGELSQEHSAEDAGVGVLQPPEIEATEDSDGANTVAEHVEHSSQPSRENTADETPVSEPQHRQVSETATAQHEHRSSAEETPVISETFTTSKQHTYTVLKKKDTKVQSSMEDQPDSVFFTEVAIEDPLNLDHIVLPDEMIAELKRSLRLRFYEHLEVWFDETASSSHSIVLAKKEELKSELDLRCHLHQPRSRRIKMDIHNVRAAELRLHSDRVDRHCEGVNDALDNLKQESILLIEKMKKETQNFRSKISGMENTFLNGRKSDKLVTLCNSLPSILDSHNSGVQTAMRNYRQHVEEMLGKLCDTNSDFIKSFRLFSEGGNFSPDEIEILRKRLHKASATIASFEGSIMVDLEGLESQFLEQATEVVKKFEDKFLNITTDMIFLENIQKLLTNLQVKIKALVANSNSQSQQINSYLEQLRLKTDACAQPNIDKEVVSSDYLYAFMKTVMEEVTQRSRYLSCLLEPNPVLQESPLQGPIATASRGDVTSRQEGKVTFGSPDSLLNPSRIGKLALDDAAVGVIKNIMKTQRIYGEAHQEQDEGNPSLSSVAVSHQSLPLAPHPPLRPSSGNKKKIGSTEGENVPAKYTSPSLRKLVKPTRFDKKYQIFGEKKEESDNFKGILASILWESNDHLLYLAEEFYKKKERRPIARPDLLQETFEDCADTLVIKLQSYENQALEYHNNCVLEFREQLELLEKLMSLITPLKIRSLREENMNFMQDSIASTRQPFMKEIEQWNQTKEEMKNLLRPSLGHPDNWHTLDQLCKEEERRQREERGGIDHNAQCLKERVSQSMQHFVTSLASLTEHMLLELDEALTVDDVLPAKKEVPKEKLSTLIRRKQAGRPLENTKYQPLIERGCRVWPGISLSSVLTEIREAAATASVTTAKTTLIHVSTVEARDAAYLKCVQDVELALTTIDEERTQQHLAAQRWEEWWSQSVLKIKELYSAN